jgi:ACS family allantoate permease-like MFS transporter
MVSRCGEWRRVPSGSSLNDFLLTRLGLAKADMGGNLAIPGWQVIFLLLGSVTAGLGVLVYFFRESDDGCSAGITSRLISWRSTFAAVPDSPMTARFLTSEERPMALERVRANQQGQRVREFKKYQVVEALKDPLVSCELRVG